MSLLCSFTFDRHKMARYHLSTKPRYIQNTLLSQWQIEDVYLLMKHAVTDNKDVISNSTGNLCR